MAAFHAVCAGPLLFLLVSASPPNTAVQSPSGWEAQLQRNVSGANANPIIARLDNLLLEVRTGFTNSVAVDRGFVPGGFAQAQPYFANRGDFSSYSRASDCLTAAIYYEAASESEAGQRAVAQVVLNRVRHPSWPDSVCGVVFQGSERRTGCQFTFTCDGSLARLPSRAGWSRARQIADSALNGSVFTGVGDATNYHTIWIRPYWAPTLRHLVTIGAHTFYRPHGPGAVLPQTFRRAPESISFAAMADRTRQAAMVRTSTSFQMTLPAEAPVAGEPKAALAETSSQKRAAVPLRALAMSAATPSVETPEPSVLADAGPVVASAGIRPL